MFISRKNFSIAEKSPRFPLLLSLALRHWRATLITDRGEWIGDQGRWVRGAWNEESGSMLGQHIKIMASIGADAPYIPIRGKGLRLISIASRYPSSGWKACARARARTRAIYARARTHTRVRRIRLRSIRYFCVTSSAACTHLAFLFEKDRGYFSFLYILHIHLFAVNFSNQTFPLFPLL